MDQLGDTSPLVFCLIERDLLERPDDQGFIYLLEPSIRSIKTYI